MTEWLRERGVDLQTIELHVLSQESAQEAVKMVVAGPRRIDVLIHNAGHMAFGLAEALTRGQYAQLP